MKEKRELRALLRGENRAQERVYLPVGIEDTQSAYLPVGIQNYKTLFTFLSLPDEPDTAPLIRLALARALTVAAPRLEGGSMAFHRINSLSGPFASGPHGIREPLPTDPLLWPADNSGDANPILCPDSIAGPTPPGEIAPGQRFALPLLVAVPGLAFTRDGRRLGRGGGYYDRFLAALLAEFANRRQEITLMGICPENRILPEIPTEEHDIRVDCLVTEKAYIICKENA